MLYIYNTTAYTTHKIIQIMGGHMYYCKYIIIMYNLNYGSYINITYYSIHMILLYVNIM